MSWADDELAILYAEWPLGTSARLIAEKIPGKSRNAVIGRAHRDGLPGRTSPILHKPNLEARVKAMLAGNVVEVQFDGCEWLDGEPSDQNRCGESRQKGSSYCPEHHARCYRRHMVLTEDERKARAETFRKNRTRHVAKTADGIACQVEDLDYKPSTADKLFGRVIG